MPPGGLSKLRPLDSRHRQPIRIVLLYVCVARINEKHRHKLFQRGVCVALKVGGAKEGTPRHSRAIQHEIQIILSLSFTLILIKSVFALNFSLMPCA
jgi:hypothetical protein